MVDWHIVTGEYPPQPGGVSDYTQLLARGLAQAGDQVHVWCPECQEPTNSEAGVRIHRLPGCFGPRALAHLDAVIGHGRGDCRLLVQYVPHMYGCKAMNLGFCSWLLWRARLRPWVMFHEVAFPWGLRQRLRHNVLGAVNRVMAAMVARAAERTYVSTLAWNELLERLAPRCRPSWLPIPSTMPTAVNEASAQAVREKLTTTGPVLGHFGTFGGKIAQALAAVLPVLLLADRNRVALLLGRGSIEFAQRMAVTHPHVSPQLHATGECSPDKLAASLKACDLLIQPFPDGVSSRRTSLMAGLALGVPIVTTHGTATEAVWVTEKLAVLVAPENAAQMCQAAEMLLANPSARREWGLRGSAGYASHFSIDQTIRALRQSA